MSRFLRIFLPTLQQDDLISLTPGQKEKDSLGLLSDAESVASSDNLGNVVEPKKSNRFCQYLVDNPPEKSPNVLSELFGVDAGLNQTSDTGISLDQSQIDILSKSWRCEHPEKLSAYKEEYRSFFSNS